jgi:hypothetical protein
LGHYGSIVEGSIVVLGHALQRLGFRVTQHPAFGDVEPIHNGHSFGTVGPPVTGS